MAKSYFMEQKITDTLKNNYMPYAMSVIVSRAIPEIDGFKPSHRKLLFTMYKMGLLKGNRTKSANVVGQTMKLNPHGDMAIYETLVRLTRGHAALLHPLIDSKGNFGKQYARDMAYAAPRYTEVKLDTICNELFRDIDKNTVDFIDNYDGTLKEPLLLPTTFPNILVNNNQGIAVGMASNLCSFNLKEVCETTIAYLKNENINIIDTLTAPDFPSGGQLIYNPSDIKRIYQTGKGSFKLRSKYRYDAQNNCLEIYELPYTTTAEAVIDKIVDLVKSSKLKDITDIRDETDLNGLKVTLDLKRNVDADKLMNILFKLTPLQDSFSCNFNVLIDGKPQTLGIKPILHAWTAFRINCIKKLLRFAIDKKSEKLHLLRGLKKILLDIDKAIAIIRNTKLEIDVVPNLISGFEIDQVQAEFIAEIRLRNLNEEYILKRTNEIDNLEKEIKDLTSTLENDTKIKSIIRKQLREISAKYGKDRLTELIHEKNVQTITQEHLIEEYNVKIFITKQNYLKKISLASLRGGSEQKLKDDDAMMQEIDTSNKSDLLLFSNKCTVYKLKVHEISDCKASTLGEYLPNLLQLEPDERIIYIVGTQDYIGNMFFAFDNGKAAKIELISYATKTNRKKLANAYHTSAKLVYITYLPEGQEIELVAFSSIDKVLIFNTENINPKTTRDSQGVQVLKPKKGSRMLKLLPIEAVTFEDIDYYRTKNLPATGKYLKQQDNESQQLSLV